MVKSILPLICLFFISINLLAQQKVIYREHFRNNKNNWSLHHDKNFVVQIEKGELFVKKLQLNRESNGCLWYSSEIPGFEADRNFTITFLAKIISLEDELKAVDFQWGELTDSDTVAHKKFSLYQMIIKPTDISLAKFNRSEGWTYYDRYANGHVGGGAEIGLLFKKNRYNKYEIQQKDGRLYFRFNDKLVYEREVTPIRGSEIGIQQCLKSAWKISKIVVRQG